MAIVESELGFMGIYPIDGGEGKLGAPPVCSLGQLGPLMKGVRRELG